MDRIYQIIGITSFGDFGCGSKNSFGVYTRVSSYLDWIENIVWPEEVSLRANETKKQGPELLLCISESKSKSSVHLIEVEAKSGSGKQSIFIVTIFFSYNFSRFR